MVVSLVDEETIETVEEVELSAITIQELDDEYLFLETRDNPEQVFGTMFNVEEGRLELIPDNHRLELIGLASWWLSNNVCPIVSFNGEKPMYRGDETLAGVERVVVGESKMESFYVGEEIPLLDGLSAQVSCDWIQVDLPEGQDTIWGKKDNFWKIQTVIYKDGVHVGLLQGNLFETNGVHRLILDHWETTWDDDEPGPDIFAIQYRYLMNKFDNLILVKDPEITKINEDEMVEKSSYWLGF